MSPEISRILFQQAQLCRIRPSCLRLASPPGPALWPPTPSVTNPVGSDPTEPARHLRRGPTGPSPTATNEAALDVVVAACATEQPPQVCQNGFFTYRRGNGHLGMVEKPEDIIGLIFNPIQDTRSKARIEIQNCGIPAES